MTSLWGYVSSYTQTPARKYIIQNSTPYAVIHILCHAKTSFQEPPPPTPTMSHFCHAAPLNTPNSNPERDLLYGWPPIVDNIILSCVLRDSGYVEGQGVRGSNPDSKPNFKG